MLRISSIVVKRQLTELSGKHIRSISRAFSDVHVKQSTYPDVVIPEVSSCSFVLGKLKAYGDNIAMVENANGNTVTFKQLYDKTIKCAAALNTLGLEKNDVVGICSLGNVEFVSVLLATLACGAIVTTCNPYFHEGEYLHQLTSSRPKFIFTDANSSKKIDNIANDLPGLQNVFQLGQNSDGNSYTDLIEGANEKDFPNTVESSAKEDVAMLLYSSGTTGLPKGVMITHYNVVTGLILLLSQMRLVSSSTLYNPLPLFHIGGLYFTLSSLIRGVKVVIDQGRFSVERMLQTIEKYKITCLVTAPPNLLAMSKTNLLTKYDTSSVKRIACGAAPIATSAFELVRKRYNAEVIAMYGLTECMPVSAGDSLCPSNSVGVILNNTEIKVIDLKTGEDLRAGKVGEILVKGPQMMKGYFNNFKATAETIDQEGWLHTGDIGHYDDQGILYIADRRKELIKFKAFQVAPAELESTLVKHQKIADAVVIGIPDEEAGELPKAFVVKADIKLSEREVIKYIQGML